MDPLFPVANAFHIGAYQVAINEGADLNGLSENDAVERDAYVYRSYIALGSHQLVLSEINDSAPTALQAVRLLALYLSNESERPAVLESLERLQADPAVSKNHTLLLCAASVLAREGNYPEALKACNAVSHLELQALCVQLLLAMDRPDVAERTVKAMVAVDDDATLTQLAGAWCNLGLGGGVKVQEAAYAFQELGDKYVWTPKLYCGAAVCHMHQGQWDEAEKDLMEALTKDGKDPETLANLVVCNLHLGRRTSTKMRTYLAQLKAVSPAHPLLAKMAALEGAFESAAAAAS